METRPIWLAVPAALAADKKVSAAKAAGKATCIGVLIKYFIVH